MINLKFKPTRYSCPNCGDDTIIESPENVFKQLSEIIAALEEAKEIIEGIPNRVFLYDDSKQRWLAKYFEPQDNQKEGGEC